MMKQFVLFSIWLAAMLLAASAVADELELVVNGVDGDMLKNVQARTQSFRIEGNTRLSRRRLEGIMADAELQAAAALRPFGYYHAETRSELIAVAERSWRIVLTVDKGPPIIISDYSVRLTGDGSADQGLLDWQADWPLTDGQVLNQVRWEELKEAALRLCSAHGYLNARFSEQQIRLDLLNNQASLVLTLDTGMQALMGTIVFNQESVNPTVLENLPRFTEGQPYDEWLLEQFRLDLWRTAYFENIEVVEERRLEEIPPRVNLVVNMEERKRNTYQGSLGYGTDTGVRAQAMWTRHLLSTRGDSLDMGVGWQQLRNELQFRTKYRQPRTVAARQYWTAELAFRTQQQKFKVRPGEIVEDSITIAEGNVYDYSFRPGWLIVRGLDEGRHQIHEHWFVEFLKETNTFSPVDSAPEVNPLVRLTDEEYEYISEPSENLSVGVGWDWPAVRGSGFATVGHRHRAHIFTSNTAWGSDLDFSQVYVSSAWNTIWRERWKFLVRGEVGYSNADVLEQTTEADGQLIRLSVTELPYLYRFKAGGSQSVRGYGFEDLSNNNVGSNNIITASAEFEYRFLDDWSAAVFFDVGNAFNDWDRLKLKKGVGLGIRWYSIAGPIRLDFANAIDEPGKPWRIHFTIGTPLL
ncbi:MAG: BamA/TamA family outer membrane protein [Xanthomonadales bacterium]|nr:BamA/TamA family outer membrane protein [Xanthomonadales bacterium]